MIQCFSKQTNATTGTGTRFNHPYGGNAAWSTSQGQHRTPVPMAGTFRNLRVRCRTGLAAGSSRTFAIYHNGSVTALSVTIGEADTTIHSNTTDSVVVAAGDTLALGSTLTGTDANVAQDVAIEFESNTDNGSVYGGPVVPLSNTTVYHNMTSEDSTDGTALAIDDSQSVWPVAGTFTRWDMWLLTAPGGANARHFVIYKNSTPQDGSGGTPDTRITISGAATTGTASFSLSVAEGDLLSWEASVTSSPAGSTALPGFAFSATTDGQFAICASDDDSFSSTIATYVGQGPVNWDTTESNVAMIGNITTFQITGWRIAVSASDNTRTFQTRVAGIDTGPSGTLSGGATTLAGAGDPAVITSADTWSFKTLPGAAARNCIVGLNGSAQEADTPGPLTSSPLLRQALIYGGMVQ